MKNAPTERIVGERDVEAAVGRPIDSPSCLALDGPNPDIKGEEEKFVPHGYMTLELNGADADRTRAAR